MVMKFAGVAIAPGPNGASTLAGVLDAACSPPVRVRARGRGRSALGDVRGDERARARASSASRRTTPSISGASRCVRPTSTPVVVDARRRAPRPLRRRARRARPRVIGSCTSLALAQPLAHELGVDRAVERRPRACRPRRENGKKPAQSSCAASRNASSSSWSRSVSPGKPTMNDDRNAASGSAARMPSISVEEAVAAPPPLHAPQQRGASACCSERSK